MPNDDVGLEIGKIRFRPDSDDVDLKAGPITVKRAAEEYRNAQLSPDVKNFLGKVKKNVEQSTGPRVENVEDLTGRLPDRYAIEGEKRAYPSGPTQEYNPPGSDLAKVLGVRSSSGPADKEFERENARYRALGESPDAVHQRLLDDNRAKDLAVTKRLRAHYNSIAKDNPAMAIHAFVSGAARRHMEAQARAAQAQALMNPAAVQAITGHPAATPPQLSHDLNTRSRQGARPQSDPMSTPMPETGQSEARQSEEQ